MSTLDRTIPPVVHTMGSLSLPVPQIESLSNGVCLHRLQGGSQEVVQLSVLWHGGLSEAPLPAVAKLAALLMPEGTSSRSAAEISEILDFNGAMLKVSSDPHTTALTVTMLSSKCSDVLPIVRDIICNPIFDKGAFDVFLDIEVQNFLLAQSKVSNLASLALSSLIKGADHPESRVPSVDEIRAISVDDVRCFYSRVVTADGCVAFLSGRYSERVLDEIRLMLGSLPRRDTAMAPNIVKYLPQPPSQVLVEKPDAVQAAVSIGLPAPARSHPDYIPLRFTVIALGGYFGSRLMKNIREDKGYTYGIAAYLLGSFDGSAVVISAQCDSAYVDLVIQEVKRELLRLASEPLPADEMLRLKQYISSSLMEILDSPFSIIDHFKVQYAVGLPEGYFDDQVEWVHRLSPTTIMEMARKYLDPSQLRIAVCSNPSCY